MSNIASVNETSLSTLLNSTKVPVLIDFGAVWCGPCKMIEPFVVKLAEDWKDKVVVVKVDVDESPNLAMQYQVMGVPTLILLKDSKPVDRTSGLQPLVKLVERFGKYI
jgi:thioredoxin 1